MKHLATYFTLFILLMALKGYAQQEPMYSQYFFNNAVINPAQAGGTGTSQVGALVRTQWLGMDGAPQTITLYGNFILPKQLGLAVGIYQDKIGVETNQHFQTDLAYHVRIFESWFLSGGIRLIASHYRANLTQVPNIDPNNPYFSTDYSSGLLVNTGFGFQAYDGNSFIGLSIPKAFSKQIQTTNSGDVEFQRNKSLHFFAYGGHNFKLSEDVVLTPSTVFRYSNAPLQIDINAVCGIKNVVDFGPLIRMSFVENNSLFDAVGFLVGVRFLEKFYFGYLYEFPLSDLHYATVQTHEVSLRLFIKGKSDKLLESPRYFL
jgi:type IX secretion system PorP/SprF family membrane protein